MIATLFVLFIGGFILGKIGDDLDNDPLLALGAIMLCGAGLFAFVLATMFLWRNFP